MATAFGTMNSASTSSSTPTKEASSSDKKNAGQGDETGGGQLGNAQVAVEFQQQLNSVLKTKPPISKEKMGLIVKEALKAIRSYKHVVYYVETFIKNVSAAAIVV